MLCAESGSPATTVYANGEFSAQFAKRGATLDLQESAPAMLRCDLSDRVTSCGENASYGPSHSGYHCSGRSLPVFRHRLYHTLAKDPAFPDKNASVRYSHPDRKGDDRHLDEQKNVVSLPQIDDDQFPAPVGLREMSGESLASLARYVRNHKSTQEKLRHSSCWFREKPDPADVQAGHKRYFHTRALPLFFHQAQGREGGVTR